MREMLLKQTYEGCEAAMRAGRTGRKRSTEGISLRSRLATTGGGVLVLGRCSDEDSWMKRRSSTSYGSINHARMAALWRVRLRAQDVSARVRSGVDGTCS